MFFTYKSLTGSSSVSDAFSAIYDAVGSVRMGVTVFYIAFMLNLVCIGGYIYRYVKLNDKRKDSLLALGTLGVSEIVALTLMPTMMTLSKIITTIDGINNGTSSLWDLGSAASSFSTNTTGLKVSLALFFLAEIAVVAVSGYTIYQEKSGKEVSVNNLQNSGKGIVETVKEYAKTEKGKKRVLIVSGVCGALIICLVGTGIYSAVKKTPIDLVSSCNISFKGPDGNGYVDSNDYNYGCQPDYDKTNDNMGTFMNMVSYSVDKSDGLSNGDKVTITAKYSAETAKSLKIKVKESEKTYKVHGLTKVYKTWKDIPKKTRDQIIQKVQKRVEKKAKSYSPYVFSSDGATTVNSVENVAIYYSFDKDSGMGSVLPVYKVSVTNDHDREAENNTLYYYSTVNVDGDFKSSDKSAFKNYMDYYKLDDDETEADVLDKIANYENMDEDDLVH